MLEVCLSLWIFPQARKVLCPECFFGNMILRFCFRAIVTENRKAVIVEGRLVSSHIPLRPKHWFARGEMLEISLA